MVTCSHGAGEVEQSDRWNLDNVPHVLVLDHTPINTFFSGGGGGWLMEAEEGMQTDIVTIVHE